MPFTPTSPCHVPCVHIVDTRPEPVGEEKQWDRPPLLSHSFGHSTEYLYTIILVCILRYLCQEPECCRRVSTDFACKTAIPPRPFTPKLSHGSKQNHRPFRLFGNSDFKLSPASSDIAVPWPNMCCTQHTHTYANNTWQVNMHAEIIGDVTAVCVCRNLVRAIKMILAPCYCYDCRFVSVLCVPHLYVYSISKHFEFFFVCLQPSPNASGICSGSLSSARFCAPVRNSWQHSGECVPFVVRLAPKMLYIRTPAG